MSDLKAWTDEARELGRRAGEAAGSWAADGNTSDDHRRRMLAMMEAGDPAYEQFLPAYPDLSGEWAGDPTPTSLARDITGLDDPGDETTDAIADAWEEGARETFEDSCVRALRGFLPDDTGRIEADYH